jgi:GTP-binding protein Era
MSFRCGHIAIVGRPNVGKSTLLNQLVGQKISIVSSKVQTTRMRVRGINTTEQAQFIYIDTPGYQQEHHSTLNNLMNKYVESSLGEVDVVLFVVEAMRWGKRDAAVLKRISEHVVCIAVVNKIDPIADKSSLLPFIAELAKLRQFAAIVPVSAEQGTQVPLLQTSIEQYLPLGPALYEEDALTDRSDRFMAAELVREKVFRFTGDEIPYGTTVMIEKFEQQGNLRRVFAAIVLDNLNHKPMVLGKQGTRIKQIASSARADMEKLWGGKVYLELFVKVKSGWHESKQSLEAHGYDSA